MRSIFILLNFFMFCCNTAIGVTYGALDARTQNFVSTSAAHALQHADIAIVHSRSDEWLREDTTLSSSVRIVLGLQRHRLVTMLKGASNIPSYGTCYLYAPGSHAPGQPHVLKELEFPPPYEPTVGLGDDLTRLVFLRRQTTPLKNRILRGNKNRWGREEISADAINLNEHAFVEKYNLDEVFSNRVYQVIEGCVFRVNCPVPELPDTKMMDLNRENLERSKSKIPELQKMSSLLELTRQEMSELVFLAYWIEKTTGAPQYAAAQRRNANILLPMNEAGLETDLGKRVQKALRYSDAVAE